MPSFSEGSHSITNIGSSETTEKSSLLKDVMSSFSGHSNSVGTTRSMTGGKLQVRNDVMV